MLKKVLGVIPARIGSTRFPGKPLKKIAGREMILRTLDRARECQRLSDIWVATDSEEIFDLIERDGGHAIMTDGACETGTDRIVDALKIEGYNSADCHTTFPWEAVVNIQGDEPLLPSANVDIAIDTFFQDNQADMATLVTPLPKADEWIDRNIVKCVFDHKGYALFFSRHPIQQEANLCFRHIGVYIYRPARLFEYVDLQERTLEKIEMLEQVRALEARWKIKMIKIEQHDSPGIDTPEQLKDVEARFF